jgi:Predicted membrane protein (DUF2142)
MTRSATEIDSFGPRRAKLALAVGLVLIAIAIATLLSQTPLTVGGTNSVATPNKAGSIQADRRLCVNGGTVPQGTTAIRIPFGADIGPRLSVTVSSGSVVSTTGTLEAGWGVDDSATVPVARVAQPISEAQVCIAIGPIAPARTGLIIPALRLYTTAVASTSLVGPERHVRSLEQEYLRLEYLRSGHTSWWSLVPSIARHLGLGHAIAGIWNAWIVLTLMLAVILFLAWLVLGKAALYWCRPAKRDVQAPSRSKPDVQVPSISSRLTLRAAAALRRIPRTAWVCVLIACLNAACWSIITPAFQAPDEPAQFAYTQQLAEHHRLPASNEHLSAEENIVLSDLHEEEVRWHPENSTIATEAEQRRLRDDLARHPSRRDGEGAEGAAADPPLYYVLETVPYSLASSGTLIDQLTLMRLLSVLMAGVTALFVFLFVRETLPAVPWAWTVGGLGVALTPTLGFISGAVNPDSMLFAISAAIFYCLARAFRRGLTPGRAALLGALTAVGFLTKLNFIGLALGVTIGLIVLSVRVARARGLHAALRCLAIAIAIAVSPMFIYAVANLASNHPVLGIVSTTLKLRGAGSSVFSEASYIWQFYLPRLPGMSNYFPGLSMARQVWFDKSVGFYGWLDTSFPPWVDNLALVPAGLIVLLCIRALFANGDAVRRHLGEIAVYGAIAAGLLLLLGASAYYNGTESVGFAEPRYLLPLLPLLGVVLALAARSAGRRWGPSVGVLIVVLVLAHDVFSQLLVVARYYA